MMILGFVGIGWMSYRYRKSSALTVAKPGFGRGIVLR
jgi:hypothetical protein